MVAEKTGYPSDMLDLDLDLEADLGVDTVKQADLLAAVREIYSIPRDENRKLRDFPTLAHVIRFVYEKRPDLASQHPAPNIQHPKPAASPAPSPQAGQGPVPTAPMAADPVKERLLALVAEKTGYPQDMLDLDLDLEADLGVDTVKQADLLASVREIYSIPRDENRKLRDFPTLAHVIRFVYEKRPDLASQHPAPSTPHPAPAASPAPSPQPPTPVAADPVKERLLALVAEKTGYPPDMLDPDLDLEADLGVDTVKQADLFASVRAIYNIPRDENRKLRDYPTLSHVIQFVYENRPDLDTQHPAPSTQHPEPAPAPATSDPVRERLLALVAEKTGYPQDMLDPDLDLEADLGVDTVKQADLFASVRAIYAIPRDENRKLRDYPTLSHVIRFVYENRPDLDTQHPAPSTQHPEPASAPSPQPPDALAAIPRRVPVPTLRPPLAICKPTPVALGPGRRIAIMPDKGGVAEALAERLRASGVEVLMLDGTAVTGPVHGVYWLPALDPEGKPARYGSGRLARGSARARQVAVHHHARALRTDCRAGHIPGFGDTARRAARLRRGRRGGAHGRRGNRFHQNIQTRTPGCLRQSGRFRGGAQRRGSRRAACSGDSARSRRSRDRLQGRAALDCQPRRNNPSRTGNPVLR